MKQQGVVSVQHCHCCCVDQQFQIPISYSPSSYKIQTEQQTLLETSDQQDNILAKFEKYNPNLKKYITSAQGPILAKTKVVTEKKKKQKQNPNKQTVRPIKQQVQKQQTKTFHFKRFDYIEGGCTCKKKKFEKFTWKPMFTSKYGLMIPEYKIDENGQYIPTRPKEPIKQEIEERKKAVADANTQTGKQTKPPTKLTVSIGDISEVRPPKIRPPMTNFIPKEFQDSIEKPNPIPRPVPYPSQQKQQHKRKELPITRNPDYSKQKIRYPEPSVFKLVHQGKIHHEQQKSIEVCNCQCHTKNCNCRAEKKRQLMDLASKDQYFAQRIIENGDLSVCKCILSCCNCKCSLKSFQLPQYRLNPRSYGPLPVNQMNQIPYAGKFRRYDFNGC